MMAQRIQTVCDVHAERGEDVEAESWEVLVRKAGSRTQTREVDLCTECASALEAVARFVADTGRVVPQTRTKAITKVAASSTVPTSSPTPRKPRKAGRPVKAGTAMASCPVEGCGSVVTTQNLSRHLRQVHGITNAAGVEQPYPCPDCDRTFARAQGLGAHRYRAHGYESPTRAERAERLERAEVRAAS